MIEKRCATSLPRIISGALALVLTAGACTRGEDTGLFLASVDASIRSSSGGYELTSGTYKKWRAARQNLQRSAGDADLGLPSERILLADPSPGSIDSVVAYFERNPQTSYAIRSAGLSVRDYVLATLALYQASDRPDTLGLEPGGVPIRIASTEWTRDDPDDDDERWEQDHDMDDVEDVEDVEDIEDIDDVDDDDEDDDDDDSDDHEHDSDDDDDRDDDND